MRRVLKRLRMPPAPRLARPGWRRFPRPRAPAMPAGDLLPVDCAATRRCVFVVIEVSTRHGHVPGVTGHPDRGAARPAGTGICGPIRGSAAAGSGSRPGTGPAGQPGRPARRCRVPGSRRERSRRAAREPTPVPAAGCAAPGPHSPDAEHRAPAAARGPGWSTPRTTTSIARAEPGICARRTATRSLPSRPPARPRPEHDGEGPRADRSTSTNQQHDRRNPSHDVAGQRPRQRYGTPQGGARCRGVRAGAHGGSFDGARPADRLRRLIPRVCLNLH